MLQNLLMATGFSMAIILIVLLAWLRPLYEQAQRAQRASEDAERRIQHEAELRTNEILLQAKEESENAPRKRQERSWRQLPGAKIGLAPKMKHLKRGGCSWKIGISA